MDLSATVRALALTAIVVPSMIILVKLAWLFSGVAVRLWDKYLGR